MEASIVNRRINLLHFGVWISLMQVAVLYIQNCRTVQMRCIVVHVRKQLIQPQNSPEVIWRSS